MKKNRTFSSIRFALILGSLAITTSTRAQHYTPGEEGIKGGSLPLPGVYLRDYNFIYTGDLATRYVDFITSPGGQVTKDSNIQHDDRFAYLQAPRLIWMTNKKILGADYGMDVIVPFGYLEAQRDQKTITTQPGGRTTIVFSKVNENAFGLGDVQLEPLLLSWHKKRFDIITGYAIWAPTGDFDANHLSLGKGFWSHMLSLGGVWYPDLKKTWAISLLDRYEINHEQEQTHITYGDRNTLEWGISKSVTRNVDVGLVGYYQQTVTRDSGKGSNSDLVHVVGVGPEISIFWPRIGTSTSLRYIYEADAKGLPQGNLVALTVMKQF